MRNPLLTIPLASLAFLLSAFSPLSAEALTVGRKTVEMMENPLALDVESPRFGWQLDGDKGEMQSAYRIEVARLDKGKMRKVWDSGKIMSGESQLVPYAGPELRAMDRYFWRVAVWNDKGKKSGWSPLTEFRLAPDASKLGAGWIGAVSYDKANLPSGRNYTYDKWKKPEVKAAFEAVDSMASRSILLRDEFSIEKKVADATVFVCGLGHYELSVNGVKVGDGEFTPLWSDYDKTVYYNTYDVTPLLRQGANAVGVLLGNGFYNVIRGNRYSKLQIGFGPETLWLNMRIRYADGTETLVSTGPEWKYALSPVTFNSIYGGEDYDARLEQKGWNLPGFDDSEWTPAVEQRAPKGTLTPQQTPPVKIMERFRPVSIHKLTPEEVATASKTTKRTVDSSAVLLDMGQNLAGFPEITLQGKRGQKVTLVVGESIDGNAVNQKQTGRQHFYTYTLRGDGPETWHPRFSYYGFRYIQIEGAVPAGEPNPGGLPVIDSVESCFIYNSAPEHGAFASDNAVFDAAHRLIRNAERSNMQSVLTDCPHREKLGWLEQVHLNGPSLLYNYDMTQYLPKVLRDIADSQRPDGAVPTIAPQYVEFDADWGEPFRESPEWGATLVLSPWQYYEAYGDDSLIRTYYDNMKRYVDYLGSRAEGHLIDFGLGDWYDYGDFPSGFSRNTPVGLVASAHYYQDLVYLARSARLIGNEADAAHYSRLADEVLRAFNDKYFDAAKCTYGTGSQVSNALPLYLDMVPGDRKECVMRSLLDDIRAHGTRLTSGDVGNRYLFRALADNGCDSVMYDMHNHYEAPGYGFQLKFGATTLTEQWDPRKGASWNHFMMGQIDEWLFRSLAGIRADSGRPGMRHIIIKPSPVGGLTMVRGATETLYGPVAVSWTRSGSEFSLSVSIPANTSASVYLPGEKEPREIKSGTYDFSCKI